MTTPPTAAPTTSMVPHSEPESAFAVARSSASTRLGSAAADAGSNAALKHAMAARSGYTTQRRPRSARQESQTQDGARDVGDDHQPFPVDAVGQHARERRHDEVGQILRRQQERDGERGAGEVEHQPEERDQQEPVAAERDGRRQVDPAEVAVPAKERDARPDAALGGRGIHLRPRFVRLPLRTFEEADMLDGITWYRQSALRFADGERTVYIDPWGTDAAAPAADLILITHAHDDHLQPEEIARLSAAGAKIVAPHDVAAGLSGDVTAVAPGESHEVAGVKFTTVPAYNTAEERLEMHPKANRWVGYVLELSGGTYYHAGDTDHVPELDDLKTDVAFLPIGGTYTMDVARGRRSREVDGAADRRADALRLRRGLGGRRRAFPRARRSRHGSDHDPGEPVRIGVMVTTPTGWSRRTLHLGSLFAAAVVVGVGVWLAARAFGAGSCPEHDALPVVSSCRALVGSLAVRVGALAGAAVVVMDLTSAGLKRTAESMDEDRRIASRERWSSSDSG